MDQEQKRASSTHIPDGSHFYLGAPDKEETTLSDLVKDNKLPVLNLPNLLETFINKSRPSGGRYQRIKKDHMVTNLC